MPNVHATTPFLSGCGDKNGEMTTTRRNEPPVGSCKGMLLVAAPSLTDPNFDRSVIYVLEHNTLGAVGLVLNRPLGIEPPTSIDAWRDHAAEPATLFHGGPVELDALIAVARLDGPLDDAWTPIHGDLGSVDLARHPDEVAERVHVVRVFRGYAGWAPRQLDDEVATGAWMIVTADAEDVFSREPTSLWRRVLKRQGGRTAWLANAPDDLTSN